MAIGLFLFVMLLLPGVACSDEQRVDIGNNKPTEQPTISTLPVGNSVGSVAPDFDIQLTNGETISYATLRDDRMPVFLFFYSPY